MDQYELQQKLNNLRWSGKTLFLEEQVVLDGAIPLVIEGCFLRGPYDTAFQYAEERHATIKVTNVATPAIEVYGPYAGLTGHLFWYPEQSRFMPNYYPVTISGPKRNGGINPNVTLRHLSFMGAMSFISLTGGGQHVIDDIRGQVLGTGTGIYIDNAKDVLRIDGIHFWTNWSAEAIKYGYYNPPILGNTRGIVLNRVDWSQLSNIFFYGLHVGLQVVGVADPHISNLAIDACSVGLDLYNIGQQGLQIDNYRIAGNRFHGAWKCVPVLGRAAIKQKLQIANYHAAGDIAPIRWQASDSLLQLGNK